MKMIEAFVVLIRSHGQIANLYLIRISFFIYIPQKFCYYCTLTFDDIFFYLLACLRKENIDAIHIQEGMVGFDCESSKN